MKTIYLAGGCFWGLQKFLDQFDGVIRTVVGYANGSSEAPTYEDVCRSSGHAETVMVEYDVERICAEQENKIGQSLAVEVEPLKNFFSAEEYHQKYLDKNPFGYCHIPREYFRLRDEL